MTKKLQSPFILIHDLAFEESAWEVVLGLDQSSHDEVFWQLPAGALSDCGKAGPP